VLIAGDMRELGEQAEDLHRDAGRALAEVGGVDLVIGVGELGGLIADGAAEAGLPAERFATVEALAARVGEFVSPGDVVLLKGSRAMAMERLVAAITPTADPAGAGGG
jgi:UDP-N-acetylmuramoyl-tripeptide--D-alanyl-D-alanine ligase